MLLTDNHRTSQNQPFFSEAAGDVLSPHRKRSLDRIKPSLPHSSTFQPSKSNQPKKISHPQGAQGAQLAAPSTSPPRMGPTKSPTEKHSAKKLKPFACDEKKAGGVSGVRHLKGGKSKTSDVTLPMSMRAWYNN